MPSVAPLWRAPLRYGELPKSLVETVYGLPRSLVENVYGIPRSFVETVYGIPGSFVETIYGCLCSIVVYEFFHEVCDLGYHLRSHDTGEKPDMSDGEVVVIVEPDPTITDDEVNGRSDRY